MTTMTTLTTRTEMRIFSVKRQIALEMLGILKMIEICRKRFDFSSRNEMKEEGMAIMGINKFCKKLEQKVPKGWGEILVLDHNGEAPDGYERKDAVDRMVALLEKVIAKLPAIECRETIAGIQMLIYICVSDESYYSDDCWI